MHSNGQQMIDAARNAMPLNGQVAQMAKASLDAQFTLLSAFASQAFESLQRLVDLNLNAAKATVEDSAAMAKQLLAARDPQEFIALTVAQAQPATAKAIAYSRHLVSIAADAQTELDQVAQEQVAQTKRTATALVEELSKNAPAGAENALAFMKSAIVNASTGYEQLVHTGKQTAKAMEARLGNVVEQVSQQAERGNGQQSGHHGRSRRH